MLSNFYYYIIIFVTTCFSTYNTFLKELERGKKKSKKGRMVANEVAT